MTLSLTTHAAFLSPADRDSIEQQQQQLLRQNQQQRESLSAPRPAFTRRCLRRLKPLMVPVFLSIASR
jgi:hypothetical protein